MAHSELITAAITVAIAVLSAAVQPAMGQLLSPGELSSVHESLEGITNCTSCHTIGGKGVDEAKCLGCHETLRTRIESARGFHANLSEPCVACHKDHLGKGFELVRLDTSTFDHTLAGFELMGAHQEVNCSSCHRESLIADADIIKAIAKEDGIGETFLGLGTSCLSCHYLDSPHGNQFVEQVCSDCHVTESWKQVTAFDHGTTQFPLTGRHFDVRCQQCHKDILAANGSPNAKFEPLQFQECSACHRDVHDTSFGSNCSSCHNTSGWTRLTSERSFSHNLTGFKLLGAHEQLTCAACHRRPARNDAMIKVTFAANQPNDAYPKIEVSSCESCHKDFHKDKFRDDLVEQSCESCHSNTGWIPTKFGLERHEESRFQLTGAHLSVACNSCHVKSDGKATFLYEERQCETCHREQNPHGSQFDARMGEQSCESCHSTSAWNSDVDFDHESAGFKLLGAHEFLDCTTCHVPEGAISVRSGVTYTGLSQTCGTCHEKQDPHRDQFPEQDCGTCHEATGFVPVSSRFDHNKARFALDGAHRKLACIQCHDVTQAPNGTRFTRFITGKNQCVDCHRSE